MLRPEDLTPEEFGVLEDISRNSRKYGSSVEIGDPVQLRKLMDLGVIRCEGSACLYDEDGPILSGDGSEVTGTGYTPMPAGMRLIELVYGDS